METARKLLLITSGAAAAFFLFLLVVLSTDPGQFEARLKSFVVKTVKAETVDFAKDRNISLPDTIVEGELQQRLSDKLERRGEMFETALALKVEAAIADYLAAACSFDCDRRDSIQSFAARFISKKAEEYDLSAAAMRDFAVGQYDQRVRGLHRDLLIVAATNLIIFLVIIGLAAGRTRFMPILTKIGFIAFASALILFSWYVFGQDWMSTLVFNQFVGLSYSVFLGAIFLSLCDLLANRGRILSAIANVFGNSLTIVPC